MKSLLCRAAALATLQSLLLMPMNALASAPVPNAANLQLASVHAAVAPLASGEPLYTKFADAPVPIASITKVMTAMVVLDSGQALDEWLPIVERSITPPKNAYSRIRVGSEARRSDLLRITLMSSENLAAYVLARHFPGGLDAFVSAMNAKARELGMHNTRFVDPAGLWPENHATAADLVRMVQAAHRYPLIREMSTTSQHDVHFRNPRYSLSYGNTNSLVRSPRWDVHLSKTGYLSEAGRCLVMVTEVQGEPMVMVLLDSLGSRTPLGDAGRIRRWLETGDGGAVAGDALNYERVRTAERAASLNGSGRAMP